MAGGAPKGNTNRKGKPAKMSADIAARLAKLNCDPIEGMATIAKDAYAAGELAIAGKMYAELAQYVAPKLRAIEHSGEGGGAIGIRIERVVVRHDTPSD